MAKNICYTYRTVSKSGKESWHFSVRASNDHSNALEFGSYSSRQGRNARVRKIKVKYKTLEVIQSRPKK